MPKMAFRLKSRSRFVSLNSFIHKQQRFVRDVETVLSDEIVGTRLKDLSRGRRHQRTANKRSSR